MCQDCQHGILSAVLGQRFDLCLGLFCEVTAVLAESIQRGCKRYARKSASAAARSSPLASSSRNHSSLARVFIAGYDSLENEASQADNGAAHSGEGVIEHLAWQVEFTVCWAVRLSGTVTLINRAK